MSQKNKAANDANPKKGLEGEGNKTADLQYRKEAEKFARSGKVEPAAREAQQAVERKDEKLEKAAAEGRKPSTGDLKSDLAGPKR